MSTRKKRFIKFMADNGLESEWDNRRRCFKDFPAHFAWQAFNAALDGAEVKMPKPMRLPNEESYGGDFEAWEIDIGIVHSANRMLDRCASAARSAGLKVKT